MTHEFDKDYWDRHWQRARSSDSTAPSESSPSGGAEPVRRSRDGRLVPGTALDAGCGEGAEAIWLASPAGR